MKIWAINDEDGDPAFYPESSFPLVAVTTPVLDEDGKPVLDENGEPKQDTSLHRNPKIPAEAFEVTEEDWENIVFDASNYEWDGGEAVPRVVDLVANARNAKIAQVISILDQYLRAGVQVTGGLHVALDDSSRADLTAMGTTALAASGGGLPWPDSYAQGWISTENIRIPLETPESGLQLAAFVGNQYALLRQYARNLKDELAAAETQEKLATIDVTTGWP
ncbi:hypothetical protein SAMN05216548_114134 [Faunimonas pinastri]|uniref:DUF4376 domain-containing protein n=1 Tax=Faunimonas pinastri TaxID=1855383 RepID=A0A1H9N129_9HYPH|nr:hypothetical protein [Faunimonas pinastri]SER29531.1 hypothetical protein SAMN05216548_114134 [Faunimonas pinastri]